MRLPPSLFGRVRGNMCAPVGVRKSISFGAKIKLSRARVQFGKGNRGTRYNLRSIGGAGRARCGRRLRDDGRVSRRALQCKWQWRWRPRAHDDGWATVLMRAYACASARQRTSEQREPTDGRTGRRTDMRTNGVIIDGVCSLAYCLGGLNALVRHCRARLQSLNASMKAPREDRTKHLVSWARARSN